MIFVALLLSAQQIPATEPAQPTARETYIGCSLLVRNVQLEETRAAGRASAARPFDASGCYWVAVRALSDHSIDAGDDRAEYAIQRPRFCPPSSLGLSVHDIRPLASAYLLYFERRARQVADRPAFPVFLTAMVAMALSERQALVQPQASRPAAGSPNEKGGAEAPPCEKVISPRVRIRANSTRCPRSPWS